MIWLKILFHLVLFWCFIEEMLQRRKRGDNHLSESGAIMSQYSNSEVYDFRMIHTSIAKITFNQISEDYCHMR